MQMFRVKEPFKTSGMKFTIESCQIIGTQCNSYCVDDSELISNTGERCPSPPGSQGGVLPLVY